MGLATLARKNRLFAWFGSRVSNVVILPFVVLAEVQLSYRVRTGAWLVIDRRNIFDQAPHLILDWCIGMFPVGGAIGLSMGFAAYAIARRRERIRASERACETAIPHTPALDPPPSSESRV